ncbi:MAG: TonB-dependent receptor [Novosphingobium sp.]|nr:TonB-dependent receptor [Novosphingobium sp.]
MSKTKVALWAAGSALSAISVQPASAQVQDRQNVAAQSSEIIVTARKRSESLLDVPVVATALDQAALEQRQVIDLYSVTELVPSLVLGEGIGTVGIQASLRGIGPTSQTATVDQSVSLVIDGLQLSQGFAFRAGMFDIGQVEVLKGPQALFFGKNNTAGVISLRGADPTDEFELIARAGYEFEADEAFGELIVSGPVSNTIKARLAARYSDAKGFFRNTGQPLPGLGTLAPKYRRMNNTEQLILRGTILFDPSEDYNARLKVNYVDDRWNGTAGDSQLALCPDGLGGVPPLNIPFLTGSECKLDRYVQVGDLDPDFWPNVPNGGVPFLDSQQYFGSLEQNLNLSPVLLLTSVTGGYWLNHEIMPRGNTSGTPTIAPHYGFRSRQFTQELRLTSDFDGPLNLMFGGYFQDGKYVNRNRLLANTAFGLPAILQNAKHRIDIKTYSLFGQAIWNISDAVELAGGARWTDETRKHSEINFFTGNPVNLLVPKLSSSNISPEVTISYKPHDDINLFASYRQGFKSGSFNTIVFIDENTRADFNDEKAEGFEVGVKGLLFDRSLSFSLAGYHYKYSDLQVGANDKGPSGLPLLRTVNAASAKVQGVELEATYSPPALEGFTLRGAVNYNRARFERFTNAPCANGQTIAEGCDQFLNENTGRFTSQDLSGRPLVRSPDWSGNVAFDYETGIGGGKTLAFGSSVYFSSSYFTNLTLRPAFKQDGFAKIGANVALRGEDDAWELSLIGNNLNNKIIAATCSNANTQNGSIFGGQITGSTEKGPAGDDESACVPQRGREVWLRATVRLGRLFN